MGQACYNPAVTDVTLTLGPFFQHPLTNVLAVNPAYSPTGLLLLRYLIQVNRASHD